MTGPAKGSLTLSLKSTPFAHDPPGAEAYYEALGRAVFLWGRCENLFSTCLMSIRALPEGRKLAPEFPVAFGRKAKLWKRAFAKMPALQPWRSAASKLITEIMECAQDRHIILHGAFEMFVKAEPLTAKLVMVSHKGGGLQIRRYEIRIDQLQDIASEADRLGTCLIPYLFALSQLTHVQPAARKSGSLAERSRRLLRTLLRLLPIERLAALRRKYRRTSAPAES